ncbi:hypothetical protein [Bdellovibrio sp.]|uniref:hypothetical protein n=1 Tax=Bdellovibrio sp. TaxID=28201 RepID=UPI0039E6A7E1
MKLRLLILTFAALIPLAASAGGGSCSSVFSTSSQQTLREDLEPFFQEARRKSAEKILTDIERRLSKNNEIDQVTISKVAGRFYESIQDPLYRRVISNFSSKKNAEQIKLTEEFASALTKALKDSGVTVTSEMTWRLRYIQNRAPLGWLRFMAIHAAINFSVHHMTGNLFMMPVYLPRIANPTFLQKTSRFEQGALFAEKVLQSGLALYVTTSLAWILSNDERRAEAFEPIFQAFEEFKKQESEQQIDVSQRLASKLSPEQLAKDSQDLLNQADKLLAELEKN